MKMSVFVIGLIHLIQQRVFRIGFAFDCLDQIDGGIGGLEMKMFINADENIFASANPQRAS